MFFKISQNSQENACTVVSFLIKFQASNLQLYRKRERFPNTLFLLENFLVTHCYIVLVVNLFYVSVYYGSCLRLCLLTNFPTNTLRVLHVETTWNRSFPRRFNVEYTVEFVPMFSFISIFFSILQYFWQNTGTLRKICQRADFI